MPTDSTALAGEMSGIDRLIAEIRRKREPQRETAAVLRIGKKREGSLRNLLKYLRRRARERSRAEGRKSVSEVRLTSRRKVDKQKRDTIFPPPVPTKVSRFPWPLRRVSF